MSYALPRIKHRNYTPEGVMFKTINNAIQGEALLNEVKGNLFEYLIASSLSVTHGFQRSFVESFEASENGKSKELLKKYQKWLLENDRELYSKLPELGRQVAGYIDDTILRPRDFMPSNISVVGKSFGGKGDDTLGECDLFIHGAGEGIPISIKLCKKGAYVNTKSGGVRSFISKYFSSFPNADFWQEKCNQVLMTSFDVMADQFYQWADLGEVTLEGKEEKRQFSAVWEQKGYPNLPGEVAPECKEFLSLFYHSVISVIHQAFEEFYSSDRENFVKCLAPIVGLTNEDVEQVTCYRGEGYELKGLSHFSQSEFTELSASILFNPLKEGLSSFSMNLGEKVLQIRVKPMNKFTVSALKVNCSLKD